MKIPIIISKLKKPHVEGFIKRKSLLNKLDKSQDMLLVSAPAGAGKSTLISDWLEDKKDYIWYSLDEYDDDLVTFMTYLVEALKPINPSKADLINHLIDGISSIGPEKLVRGVISYLADLLEPVFLILDDFHMIHNSHVYQFVEMVMTHLHQVRLCIITREDPDLPLHKYRLKGSLIEVRLSDLKFSFDETKELSYLQASSLTDDELALLKNKTEGWIAALQLAFISLKDQDDKSKFLREFNRYNYYLVDYLLEEILGKLSEDMQSFLLKLSLLDYFTKEKCVFVFDMSADQVDHYLEQMKQKNLFIILHENYHYRLHHLIRDLLKDNYKGPTEDIYNQLGHWYRESNFELAMAYYLKAGNHDLYAELLEISWNDYDINLQATRWLQMARSLDEDYFDTRPVLAMGLGWALIDSGEVGPYDYWLNRALTLYGETTKGIDHVVHDHKQYELLPVTVQSAFAYMAAARGEVDQLFSHTNEAFEAMPKTNFYKRGVVGMLLGFAHWSRGQLDVSEQIIRSAMEDIQQEVNLLTKHSFVMVLIELYIQAGRFDEAKILIVEQIQIVEKKDIPILLASFYLAYAKVTLYRGHLQEAKVLLDKSHDYGKHLSLMDWAYKYYCLSALVYQYEGLHELALEAISQARQSYFMNPIPDDFSIDFIDNLIKYKMGLVLKLVEADDNMFNFYDRLLYVLVNQRADLLDEMIQDLDDSRKRHYKDLEALKALLNGHEMPLDQDYFLPDLMFSNQNHLNKVYTREHANLKLSEPLTIRELEVLDLIGAGMSNQEISDTLFLALSTVKGYIQNIYGKLEVKRRTEAVNKARKLDLLE